MKSMTASRFAILVALGLASTAVPAFADSGAVPGCNAQKSDQEQLGESTGPAQKADQEQLGENTGRAQKADQEQLGNGQYKVASNANPC